MKTLQDGTMMTATHNRLFISLMGLAIGWVLALRALSQLGQLETMLGLTFLTVVAWGVFRAARV